MKSKDLLKSVKILKKSKDLQGFLRGFIEDFSKNSLPNR